MADPSANQVVPTTSVGNIFSLQTTPGPLGGKYIFLWTTPAPPGGIKKGGRWYKKGGVGKWIFHRGDVHLLGGKNIFHRDGAHHPVGKQIAADELHITMVGTHISNYCHYNVYD